MPTSAPRRCKTCKQLVHGRCDTCDKPWTRKPRSWAGGSTQAWRNLRAQWLAEHPLCMDCGAIATVVCHKPGTNYATDRLNPDAIEGQRCRPCDARETARQGNDAKG